MKNQLIPICPSDSTPGEYQPALRPHGSQLRQLVTGADRELVTKHDHQGFTLRSDLAGVVHQCGGLPLVELDDGGLYAVQAADETIAASWVSALA